MANDDPIIRLEGVRKSFGKLLVLDGIDLAVQRGSTTAVMGPSGSGKSVLLKHIVRLLKPDQGRVLFDGQDITHMRERELTPIRRRIGFVFQGGALFDSMNVDANVCFPLMEYGEARGRGGLDRCRRALQLVGLGDVGGKMPEELSGGQRKRVALARAIVLEPEVILYDEPTTGLDPVRADLINELIIRLQRELHTTAVVVTHDMASIRKVADRVVMLHEGRFIADGSPEDLARSDNPIVRQFMEGRAGEQEMRELENSQARLNSPEGQAGTQREAS